MKKNKYEIDMVNGSIMDKLVSFSLPLMATSILQLMFNAVDIIVVGHFSGSDALAAVGGYHGADQHFYESVYRNLHGGKCALRPLLCRRSR